jgi:PKD repeat protein
VDETGQSATKSNTVGVGSAAPTASFVYSPSTVNVGAQVNFDASASRAAAGQTITEYQWNFNGSIVTSGSPRTQWTFGAANTYPVSLRVTDSSGQTATTTVSVKVDP